MEGKSAKRGFPDSFWESYSAFGNIRFGERAGSGLNGIVYVWKKVYHTEPEIFVKEEYDRTFLKLPTLGKEPDVEAMAEFYPDEEASDNQDTSDKPSDNQATNIDTVDNQATNIDTSDKTSDNQAINIDTVDKQAVNIDTVDKQEPNIDTSDKTSNNQAINIDTVDKQAVNIGTVDKQEPNIDTVDKINTKQSMLLQYMSTHPTSTAKELSQMLGIGITRLKHFLIPLVNSGLVLANGANKNRTYSLNIDTVDKLDKQ